MRRYSAEVGSMKNHLMLRSHGGCCFEELGSGHWSGIASVYLISGAAGADAQAVVAGWPCSTQSQQHQCA